MLDRPISSGSVLDNRYRLGRCLTRDALGETYEAAQIRLERPVMIRFVSSEVAADPDLAARVDVASREVAKLQHPSIPHVIDYGACDGRPYVVTELATGRTIDEMLEDGGKMAPEHVLPILVQIAEALEHAHKAGIVHGELSPSHVKVDSNGRVWISDFGMARARFVGAHPAAVDLLSVTSPYLSPERAKGSMGDELSDLYALGAIGYFMLVGRGPFDASTRGELIVQQDRKHVVPCERAAPLPAEASALGTVIDRLLSRSPQDRYPTATWALNALRAARAPLTLPDVSLEAELLASRAAMPIAATPPPLDVPRRKPSAATQLYMDPGDNGLVEDTRPSHGARAVPGGTLSSPGTPPPAPRISDLPAFKPPDSKRISQPPEPAPVHHGPPPLPQSSPPFVVPPVDVAPHSSSDIVAAEFFGSEPPRPKVTNGSHEAAMASLPPEPSLIDSSPSLSISSIGTGSTSQTFQPLGSSIDLSLGASRRMPARRSAGGQWLMTLFLVLAMTAGYALAVLDFPNPSNEARDVARRGDLDRATQQLRSAVLAAPNDAKLHAALGYTRLMAGDAPEALKQFGEAAKDPNAFEKGDLLALVAMLASPSQASLDAQQVLSRGGQRALEVLRLTVGKSRDKYHRCRMADTLAALGDQIDLGLVCWDALPASACGGRAVIAQRLGQIGDRRAVVALESVAGVNGCADKEIDAALAKLRPSDKVSAQ